MGVEVRNQGVYLVRAVIPAVFLGAVGNLIENALLLE